MNRRHAKAIRIGINSRRMTYTHSVIRDDKDGDDFFGSLDMAQWNNDVDAYNRLTGRAHTLATKARQRTEPFTVERYEPGYHEAVARYEAKSQHAHKDES